LSELTVQCRFVKVRGDLMPVRKIFWTNIGDSNGSDTDSSVIMVSTRDFITLDSDKVYRVKEVLANGIVRCVSPANEINDPIVISSLAETNDELSRQYR
jgi:hypothetical protein